MGDGGELERDAAMLGGSGMRPHARNDGRGDDVRKACGPKNMSDGAPSTRLVRISIVICTLDRPKGLRRALRSCLEQDHPTDLGYEVVVVDNSPTANAQDLVTRASGDRTDLVRYVSDPRTNIAHARNTGVATARGDYIAFMDDDMAAPPGWLTSAFALMQRTGADVLLGKIVPEFEDGPGWGGSLRDPVRWFGRELAFQTGR